MLYQKLLMGNNPYFISVGAATAFEIHRHPEIELSYCLDGTYDIICEKRRYSMNAGDLMVVSPMASHEIPENMPGSQRITIELGYTLLGEYFESFKMRNSSCYLYRQSQLQQSKLYQQLVALLDETAALYCEDSAFCKLSIKGNLYKISALLLQMLNTPQTGDVQSRKLNDIKRVDMALETIYSRYFEPLSIELISASCGYSKSNFCKVFKSVTGDTFHNTLNRHRIEMACMLLCETDDSIERVAQETGFSDLKSFCRVFKKQIGKNAREYRKSMKTR